MAIENRVIIEPGSAQWYALDSATKKAVLAFQAMATNLDDKSQYEPLPAEEWPLIVVPTTSQ
jgi:hypothetical protein